MGQAPQLARRVALLASTMMSCAPADTPPPTSVPPLPAAAKVLPTATAAPAPPPPDEPEPPAPKPVAKAPAFPPPPFSPPVARTAREGDGRWTSLLDGPPSAPPLLARTTVHPSATKSQVYVVVVAIDLRRVAVRMVAGTHEPVSETVPPERRPALIPPADLPSLLAVFNGGFLTHHGAWGMTVGLDVIAPPKPEGCAVVLLERGVEIRTFEALTTPAGARLGLRQTPPCLVERGEVNPALLGPVKPRPWGMSETGGLDIRRSSLAVTADPGTLLYGLGESVTPREMAEAMRAAGAVDAAELDVNWSYTRFLLYGPPPAPGAAPQVMATLIPKIKHAPEQYVRKPSERDFFYLVRRPPSAP